MMTIRAMVAISAIIICMGVAALNLLPNPTSL